jgi:hypothetical protein
VATRQPPEAEIRLLPVRLGILGIVIAVAFAFDDPAAVLADPAPNPLRWRRLIRAVGAVLASSLLTSLVLALAAADMDLVWVITGDQTIDRAEPVEPEVDAIEPRPEFPAGRVALETATMIGFALAAAAAVARRGETEPGRVASSVVLGVYAVSWMIPDPYKPWASPGDQRWEAAADWWWAALAITTMAVVVLSWDSRVGRHLVRRGHPAPRAISRAATRV